MSSTLPLRSPRPRPAASALVGLVGALWGPGCGAATDYNLKSTPDPSFGPDEEIDLTIDLALQRNEWGANTTRCQIQVAFRPNPGIVAASNVVLYPEAPGLCAHSSLPPRDPEAGVGGEDDNWQVTGGVLGPEQVTLSSGPRTLSLDGVVVANEALRYEWADCNAEDFPTSATLDLHVPPSRSADGVPDFDLDELVAVGPLLDFETPGPSDATGAPQARPDRDLLVTWTMSGEDPLLDGAVVHPRVLVKVLSQDMTGGEDDRWLVCEPTEEGVFDIPAADIEELTDGRVGDDARFHTHIDVHSEIRGEGQETPWGRVVLPRAHVSDGGPITFTDSIQ